MRYEWDEAKNQRNFTKHKIHFETAALVFDDPCYLALEDCVVEGEVRWKAIGTIGGAVVILVVHTYREIAGEESIRIISARRATTQERREYEAHRFAS